MLHLDKMNVMLLIAPKSGCSKDLKEVDASSKRECCYWYLVSAVKLSLGTTLASWVENVISVNP